MSTFSDLEFTEVNVSPVLAAQIPAESGPDPASISGAMGSAFGALMGFMQKNALIPTAPPRAIYTSYSPEGTKFIVAMPIANPSSPIKGDPGFVDTLSGGKALRFTHHGPYPDLMKTYERITQFLLEKGFMKSEADWAKFMPMWEEYLNDPTTTPEAELATFIYLPIAR
jgi:effector-binding domain-containing protein